jgi:hypothetical protein
MHFMNPARQKHMESRSSEKPARSEAHKGSGAEHASASHHPSIHIHSHDKGHTVHIMHPSGEHEKHEHEAGDAEGIKAHVDEHIGGIEGQDHGFSSGEEMENEDALGGPGV